MEPNDASNMRLLYYAKMYIIGIMQLAGKQVRKQKRCILMTTTTDLLLITQQLNKYWLKKRFTGDSLANDIKP